MIATLSRPENSSTVASRRPLQVMRASVGGIGCSLPAFIRALGCKIERYFAIFADLPYENPVRRQEWEQMLETEPRRSVG
jgi:hypothetical protein